MAGHRPITRPIYTDPLEKVKEKEPFYNTYELFLYENVTKGSMPIYKITCNDLDKLKNMVTQLKEKFNLKTPGSIVTTTTKFIQDIYNEPIIVNINTRELFVQ